MEKMGIFPVFINFIKKLCKQNTSLIISNGYLSPHISLQRGLGEGCPLFVPLYMIQGEVTTTNINQNKDLTGTNIPNQIKQVEISQYADDSNFLLKNQESVNNVLTLFRVSMKL